MSQQERMRSRTLEISKKLDALKGRDKVGEAYKKQRDKAKAAGAPEQGRRQLDGGDDEEGGAAGGGGSQAPDDTEGGEGYSEWAFDRAEGAEAVPQGRFGGLASEGLISDSTRAIAEVELEGKGGASARQILDAAFEFACADEYDEAAQLLEIARGRIDKEQILRKIDNETAQEYDDECVWALANAYYKQGKLTLAVDRFGMLKQRLSDPRERMRAERLWAESATMLAGRLDQVRRYEDAETLFSTVLDEVNKATIGDAFYEETQLNFAMTLQNMYRSEEAIELLLDVKSKTYSRKRRSQATFVLDVINVGQQATRNEEFHKVWDDNFVLPADSYSTSGSGVRVGTGGRVSTLNLTDNERKFRGWARQYWEERLSSPLYYAFLTLFVTWPFAIPVVSIMGKMDK